MNNFYVKMTLDYRSGKESNMWEIHQTVLDRKLLVYKTILMDSI